MKRSITRWTTSLATAALLAIPAAGLTQTPAAQQPPAQQQPPSEQPLTEPPVARPPTQQPPAEQPPSRIPPPTEPATQQPPIEQPATAQPASQPSPAAHSKGNSAAASPQEHLRQAKAALDSIPAASVTGRARTQIAELKRHMNALDKMAASPATAAGAARTPGITSPRAAGSANWGTHVAAIDKILGELTVTDTPTATIGGATGTSGSNKPTGTTGNRSKAATAVSLDEATLAKLMEVRTHVVAFATGMSAPQTAPKGQDHATAGDAPAAAPAATQGMASAAESQVPAAQGSAPAAESPANPADAASAQATASPSPAAPEVDQEAVRRHLTAARDSLAELTKLPAAAQLQGEARTQVSQLIANFNALITTQSNWTASYAKVEANLNALLGPDMEAAAAPAPASSTASDPSPTGAIATTGTSTDAAPTAVGTSGAATAELDAAVRAKLIDLRRNLSEFQKSAGVGK